MNPVRVLLQQATKIPGSIKGEPSPKEIDQSLSAAICAGMGRREYVAVRLKWLKDEADHREICRYLSKRLWKIAYDEKWTIKKDQKWDTVQLLAELAYLEMLDPPRYRSNEAKFMGLGIPERTWYRNYNKYYKRAYSELDEWANMGIKYIYRVMS